VSNLKNDPTPIPANSFVLLTIIPAGLFGAFEKLFSVSGQQYNATSAFRDAVDQWLVFTPDTWGVGNAVITDGGFASLPNAVIPVKLSESSTVGAIATAAASVGTGLDCVAVQVCGAVPCSAEIVNKQGEEARNPFTKCLEDPGACVKRIIAVPLALFAVVLVAYLVWANRASIAAALRNSKTRAKRKVK